MLSMRSFKLLVIVLVHLGASQAAAQVEALVETRTFPTPSGPASVDVNIAMIGSTATLVTNAHAFQQARVEALTLITRGNEVVDYRKTEVNGPEISGETPSDFIHQERFVLEPGSYDLEVELRDLNDPGSDPTKFKGPLAVAGAGTDPRFSDVLLLEKLEGIEPTLDRAKLVPRVSTYYPSDLGALGFYVELMNMDRSLGEDSLFLMCYQIEGFENHQILGAFRKQSRTRAQAQIPVMAEFDITSVPSGNYLLVFEARDRTGAVLARQEQFFQRNNPVSYDLADRSAVITGSFADRYADVDTLAEEIRSLRPIASDLERKIIDDRWKDRDMELMKGFFHSFWYNRNSYDPEGTWERYKREVIKVNQLYGCRIKRGFDTDRGYVHLKYGPPNTIMDQPIDADGLPYQIWHYYRAGRFTNKRFVFYLPDRVSECYELLHSDVPGEIKNPNWNRLLHVSNTSLNNVQDNSAPIGHGQQVLDFYNMPR